jgi:hypothetical protein
MDFRAIDLARADFELFNESSHRAGRTRLHDPRERRFILPRIPIPAIFCLLHMLRSPTSMRRLKPLGRLGPQSS